MAWSRLTEGIYFLDGISYALSLGIHTYNTWGLIMESDDVGFPELLNNDIDSYLSLQGQPSVDVNTLKYGRRKMVFSFGKKVTSRWPALVNTITEAIHGKKKVILRDCESTYGYIGRCYVRAYKTTRGIGKIQIEVDAEPYKVSRTLTTVDFTDTTGFRYEYNGKYETPVTIEIYTPRYYSGGSMTVTCYNYSTSGKVFYKAIIENIGSSSFEATIGIQGEEKRFSFDNNYSQRPTGKMEYRFPVLLPEKSHYFVISGLTPSRAYLSFRNRMI